MVDACQYKFLLSRRQPKRLARNEAELRLPGLSIFDVGLFVEAGNLWLAMPTGSLAFRSIVGAGLRYVTPIGPLALDVGVNPGFDDRINEPPVVVHFNIGVF